MKQISKEAQVPSAPVNSKIKSKAKSTSQKINQYVLRTDVFAFVGIVLYQCSQ